VNGIECLGAPPAAFRRGVVAGLGLHLMESLPVPVPEQTWYLEHVGPFSARPRSDVQCGHCRIRDVQANKSANAEGIDVMGRVLRDLDDSSLRSI